MLRALPIVLSLLLACAVPARLVAQLSAEHHDEAVPSELASEVSAALAPGGVRTTAGGVVVSLWLVKSLALSAGTSGQGWSDVAEGTLVGATRIAGSFRDVRGKRIKPGVYTLRYGIQPSNGDHLGVSPFRDFLLLSPAAGDKTLAALAHDDLVELSKTTAGGSHPTVWSIDPPVATESPLAVHSTENSLKSVIMEVPVSRGGQPAGTLKFGLALVGTIEA